jgi:hypothetical protein
VTKKVVGVFVRFRAPLYVELAQLKNRGHHVYFGRLPATSENMVIDFAQE